MQKKWQSADKKYNKAEMAVELLNSHFYDLSCITNFNIKHNMSVNKYYISLKHMKRCYIM